MISVLPAMPFRSALKAGLLAVGMAQALVARGEFEDTLSRVAVLRSGFTDYIAQDFAVSLGRDRQTMLKIPGRKAAFAWVIAELDLALSSASP